jgi:hypothetical protein
MQSHTRKLAARVQRTLLALSDEGLGETIDDWFKAVKALYADAEALAEYGQGLGYRPRSQATESVYEDLAELDEAEPEAGEIEWLTPESGVLRERLRRMQPKPFYHLVIALAGEAFGDKPFASQWGSPPGEASDGYAFMTALSLYLSLKQQAGEPPTDQFEALHGAELEAFGTRNREEEGVLAPWVWRAPGARRRKPRRRSPKQRSKRARAT